MLAIVEKTIVGASQEVKSTITTGSWTFDMDDASFVKHDMPPFMAAIAAYQSEQQCTLV